jgi:peptidoglycan-N-acetylglucosamine deacetylase
VLRAARGLGLTPVLWNAAGYDWKVRSPEGIYGHLRRGIARARKRGHGANLLLHDGGPEGVGVNRMWTSTAVPMVIERMKREGCRFVTVERWAEGL